MIEREPSLVRRGVVKRGPAIDVPGVVRWVPGEAIGIATTVGNGPMERRHHQLFDAVPVGAHGKRVLQPVGGNAALLLERYRKGDEQVGVRRAVAGPWRPAVI